MTAQSGPPPVPLRLSDRPTVGGLVVPYVSLTHLDGRAILGMIDPGRLDECLRRGLCQTCGQRLTSPLVVYVRSQDLDRGYTVEPPLHPECAAYSNQGCPMLAGTMAHYRKRRSTAVLRCGNAACPCAQWQPGDDEGARAGHPAEPIYAAWFRSYAIVSDNQTGKAVGVLLDGAEPLKVVPVNPQAQEEAAFVRATRDAVQFLMGDETL